MVNSDDLSSPDTKCYQALKDLNKFKADIDKFKQINEKHNKQGELLDQEEDENDEKRAQRP